MTQKEYNAIHYRMYEIENQIRFLKENDFNTLNEISNYIVELEKEYDEKQKIIENEIIKMNKVLEKFQQEYGDSILTT